MDEPSPRADRKKPWYLVAALLGTLIFGGEGACGAYMVVATYRMNPAEPSAAVESYTDPEVRANVQAARERALEARDGARGHAFPFAVAALVIGAAMVLVSFRAMAGRPGSRNNLLQLVVVQAALGVGAFIFQRESRRAFLDYYATLQRADAKTSTKNPVEASRMAEANIAMLRMKPSVELGLLTAGSALIILALTRPRARQFFETSDPVSDP